ncbi:hypothetical protein PTKIN_Ptkin07bG0003200 [Pterospermum kingtungense]
MVLGANGLVWMDGEEEEDAVSSWTPNNNNSINNEIGSKDEDLTMSAASLSTFKSMLDNDWYMNPAMTPQDLQIRELGFCSYQVDNTLLLHHPIDSSASCSPSQQAFTLDPSHSHPFLPPKSCFSSLLNVPCNNPFDNSAFDFASETAFLAQFQTNQTTNLMGFPQTQMGTPEFSSSSEFQDTRLFAGTENASDVTGGFSGGGFDGSVNALFLNRAKTLKPLEVFPSVSSSQLTLFQKRAAMRQGSGGADNLGNLDVSGLRFGGEVSDGKKKMHEEEEIEEASIDMSGLNYDSDDCKVEESVKNGGCNSNATSTVTGGGGGGGDQKGKKKGMPAKNLMAERRRRKKLNDRLYMLRSVVPKISKMDRASILGDAIDYLKELLQRINDLHNELESTPPGSLVPPSTSFHPLTPTPPTLPCRVKEELCPSSLPSPKNQPAKVEVKVREGRAVNIHMFCARRPGLLLSTMRALDNLGLDIQQAVISCFNGFALDVFRAEQCREGLDVLPEQIKAVLLDSAGFHGIM